VVIVIIGVISAFVLPRFSDLSEQAELAQVEGIAGALKSGALTVKALYRSQGHSVRVQNLAGYGDGRIDTNNIGYPIGIDKGNGNENIGRNNAGCVGIWEGVLIDSPTVAHNNNNQQYRSYRHTGNKICSYVYRAGGDNGNQNTGLLVIKYDSRDGSVSVCGGRADLPAC
jgi:type II secretory pathway pseudopilin PulG